MLTHSCPTRCAAKSSGGERFGCLDGNQSWIEASGWRDSRAGQGARNDKMAYDKSAHEELLARIAKLNTTERDCLLSVNEGKASKDIARELGLPPNYVDPRSEELRVGKDCGNTVRSRLSPSHSNKNQLDTRFTNKGNT